jgi:predicted alpha/beta-fold hydrolase
MHNIRIPTFFVNGLDDPFLNPKLYPYKEIEANENLILGVTKRGGHCSHMTGGIRPYQWFAAPCFEFLEFLENREKKN